MARFRASAPSPAIATTSAALALDPPPAHVLGWVFGRVGSPCRGGVTPPASTTTTARWRPSDDVHCISVGRRMSGRPRASPTAGVGRRNPGLSRPLWRVRIIRQVPRGKCVRFHTRDSSTRQRFQWIDRHWDFERGRFLFLIFVLFVIHLPQRSDSCHCRQNDCRRWSMQYCSIRSQNTRMEPQ